MKKFLFFILSLSFLCCMVFSQTVTVNSAGVADYATINAAYTAVKANVATPDVINIIGGGPYLENLLINTSVTIKGDGYRPVIAATPTAGGPHATLNGNAIGIYTDAGSGGPITVRLENFVLLPDKTTAPTRGIRCNNNATGLTTDHMTIELVDVLITSNNGSDAPVSTDGLSKASLVGAKIFVDDHIYFTGIVDATLSGVISTNNYGTAASSDGLIFYPDEVGHTITIGPGCVFSYMNRIGIQVAADGAIVRMNGTKDNPIIIKGNWAGKTYAVANAGLAIFHDCEGNASYNYEMNYVFILDDEANGITTWYADPAQGLPGVTFNHCIIANNSRNGVIIGDDLIQNWIFNNCTIANNGTAAEDQGYTAISIGEETVLGTTGNVTFNDTIIAGKGSADTTNGNNTIGITAVNAVVSLNYCAKVLAGPYLLGGTGYTLGASVPTPTENNVITDDPTFVNINNLASDLYFDVTNIAYEGKGSGGTDLSGAMDFTPPTSAKNWEIYK